MYILLFPWKPFLPILSPSSQNKSPSAIPLSSGATIKPIGFTRLRKSETQIQSNAWSVRKYLFSTSNHLKKILTQISNTYLYKATSASATSSDNANSYPIQCGHEQRVPDNVQLQLNITSFNVMMLQSYLLRALWQTNS